MLRAGFVLLLLFGFAAADFTDDFESFTPGDYLESSPDWDREPDGGQAVVVEQAGNNAADAVFGDSAFVGYICTAAGFWADGSVAMDFSPSGVGSFSNVYARLDILNGGSYAAGITVFMGSFTYAYVAYVNASGDYELLFTDVGPIVNPGEWANVRLDLQGTDPVNLTLFLNDTMVAEVADSTYMLEEGICGFALFYDDVEPDILADNFEVVTSPQSFQGITFGALKGLFR